MQLNQVRHTLARHPELQVSPSGRITVNVPLGARSHSVRVLAQGDWVRVEGKIANLGHIDHSLKVGELTERVLRANSTTELVGLARDADSWLVARYDLPPEADGLELVEAVQRVAKVADRWELLWMGEDRE
jgi:hypothetical protein